MFHWKLSHTHYCIVFIPRIGGGTGEAAWT